jgi:hypothetical protein
MPPLPQSNACSLCDRPTDRPTDGSMNHLPSASHKNTRPTRAGWVFCSPEKHTGQGSLSPFLPPSESMGARPSQPGALEGAGKGKREKVEHERAKRESSYRAAGSRRPRGFAKTQRRESEAKKSKSRKVEILESRKVDKLARKPWDENSH